MEEKLTIGRVAQAAGVNVETIRYYGYLSRPVCGSGIRPTAAPARRHCVDHTTWQLDANYPRSAFTVIPE